MQLNRANSAPPYPAGPSGPTWLVTPGIAPARFDTAVGSGADVVLLDLEDSVPAGSKADARAAVLAFAGARTRGAGGPLLGVRINAVDGAEGLRDLAAMDEGRLRPDLVVVPKVESGREIEAVVQAARGAQTAPKVWALIESPRGIVELSCIVQSPGLAGVLFGAADYAAAAGCQLTSRAMWYPRAQLVTASAAAGIPAVDSPFFSLDDQDGLRRDALEAVELGFAGKVAVHPRQLSVIAQAFAPSPRELEAARAVLDAASAVAKAGGAITTADGVMVGPPLVEAALAVVRRAGHRPAVTTTSVTKAS
ncbi:HpcH/HpaI aldolase/citrate lyase family protein [Streptomyces sp. NPDC058877]|uniref:HpcH/HpaI aldolase/citrate lyase family protein n=1 Tax=unclassified Streptomyces TaxID=2593676 RepID=UPI0036AF83CB